MAESWIGCRVPHRLDRVGIVVDHLDATALKLPRRRNSTDTAIPRFDLAFAVRSLILPLR